MTNSFTLKFDELPSGEHSIDVVAYGKSLIAMAEMLKVAQATLDPKYRVSRVDLTATNEGSVETLIELAFVGVGLFASAPATAVANASSIISSAWKAVKRIKDLGVSRDQKTPTINITQNGGGTINLNLPSDQAQLLNNPKFVDLGSQIVEPLVENAAGTMEVYGENSQLIESFDTVDAEEIILAVDTDKILVSDETRDIALTCWGASYDQHKVRVGLDESSARWAEVLDPDFLAYLNTPGSAIANGTKMDVELRIITHQSSSGRRNSKWYIQKLHDREALFPDS